MVRLSLHLVEGVVLFCAVSPVLGKVSILRQDMRVHGRVVLSAESLQLIDGVEQGRFLQETVQGVKLLVALLRDVEWVFESLRLQAASSIFAEIRLEVLSWGVAVDATARLDDCLANIGQARHGDIWVQHGLHGLVEGGEVIWIVVSQTSLS